MNKEEFLKELQKLNITYDNKMLNQLEVYKEFLKEYNTHTNLTAIKEDNEIYLKHFYDSLTVVKVINLNEVNNLIDVGTGAGFPGMVLKIFFPDLNVTLLDSNNKKTKFLSELSEKLDVTVDIVNDRIENYSKSNLNRYDVVISRAVANLRVLSELSLPLLRKDGLFISMKGNASEEIKEAIHTLEIMNSKIIKKEVFELYNNAGTRTILAIQKFKNSVLEDIRSYDKILKKPLK